MKILLYGDTPQTTDIKTVIESSKNIKIDLDENFEDAADLTELVKEEYNVLILDLAEISPAVHELLEELLSENGLEIPVLAITDHEKINQVLSICKKTDRVQYLAKPFYPGELLYTLHKLEPDIIPDKSAPIEKIIGETESHLFGRSEAIEEIKEKIANIAKFPFYTVLIRGESGSGKEVVAEEIHRVSHNGGPFIERNMSSMPLHLLESELFGYEKGAFSGADKQKKSDFELAEGGTLFLDEIGDMELTHQAKILKVIEQKTVQHLGGVEKIPFNTRIICATNRDLEQMIAEKFFREDLYNRITKLIVTIPPLRERPEDVIYLSFHLLNKIAIETNVENITITFAAVESLARYSYPGNIRELENVLTRIVFENEKTITDRTVTRCLPSVSSDNKKSTHPVSGKLSVLSEETAAQLRSSLQSELLKNNYSQIVIEKTLDSYEAAVAEIYPKDTPSYNVNIKNRCVFYGFYYYMLRGVEHINKKIADDFNISANSIPNYTTQIYKTKLSQQWPYKDLFSALDLFSKPADEEQAEGEKTISEVNKEKKSGRFQNRKHRLPAAAGISLAALVLFAGALGFLSTKNRDMGNMKGGIPLIPDNTIIGLAKEDEHNLGAELKHHFDGMEFDIRRGNSAPLVTLELRPGNSGKQADLLITDYVLKAEKTIVTSATQFKLIGSGFSRADNLDNFGSLRIYQDNYNIPAITLRSTPVVLTKEKAGELFEKSPQARSLYVKSEQDGMYLLDKDTDIRDMQTLEEWFYRDGLYCYRGSRFERELDFRVSTRIDIEMVSGNWALVVESLRLIPVDTD